MEIIQHELQVTESALKLLIVDDHPLVIAGLRSVFSQATVEQADSIKACISRLNANSDHDLAILDFYLSDGDALLAIRQIREVAPSLPILVFSSNRDRAKFEECLSQGASGYLSKQADATRLLASVHAVLRGDHVAWMSHEEPEEDPLRSPADTSPMRALSERELKILALLARGLSNRKIAEDCFITENTVKTHVSKILHKLHVDSRSEAAYLYTRESSHL
jgi:DNA-binding NarL/FixJ family response regulator